MSLVFWILISFVSASVPWSLILGYIFSNKDIRTVGDKNPGGTNTLKLSGIKVGLMAIFLDISKSFFPVYFSLFYGFVGYELILICLAAISGSIFSPFLKFNGGKSLSVTCGIWLAISSGIIGPLICLMMAFSHSVQKTHIWTILFGWLGILIWVLIFSFELEYVTIFFINFILVMYKHRKEFNQKIIFRNWITGRRA
ncbi:MAG: glycerol-3-phosphate acyltransferase [Chloroflexota bacterium]|nr:glycerol-3-phosphate acyltransferase [Chloroflexota bacterium]MEC8440565.1 glycerol-3-phosphate acyltransferase [Chloroflexota bacterium]MEC8749898.1 glycerol-3-phosphate acyltransferase [Chloroflexota bacterium]